MLNIWISKIESYFDWGDAPVGMPEKVVRLTLDSESSKSWKKFRYETAPRLPGSRIVISLANWDSVMRKQKPSITFLKSRLEIFPLLFWVTQQFKRTAMLVWSREVKVKMSTFVLHEQGDFKWPQLSTDYRKAQIRIFIISHELMKPRD